MLPASLGSVRQSSLSSTSPFVAAKDPEHLTMERNVELQKVVEKLSVFSTDVSEANQRTLYFFVSFNI